jgi:ribosome-associated protein
VLVIRAERFRTQEKNRKDARDCLADLVRRATLTLVPRSLIATRSTRASKERRIKAKAAKHDSDGGEPTGAE